MFPIKFGLFSVCLLGSIFGDEPECVGNFGVEVKGGVAPILWTGRGKFRIATCHEIDDTSLRKPSLKSLHTLPSFNDLFTTPWMVGTELDYVLTTHIRLYADFQYRQALGKRFSLHLPVHSSLPDPSAHLHLKFSHYRSYSAYFGADYFFKICNHLSFFLGGKVGFTHHTGLDLHGKATYFHLDKAPWIPKKVHTRTSFNGDTVVSAGGRIGLEGRFADHWSVILTAECIGNSAPRLEDKILRLSPIVSVGDIQLPDPGSEVIFPVTLGLLVDF